MMRNNLSPAHDRREGNRFTINAPLFVIDGKQEISGFTRDLSNRGIYFYLDLATHSLPAGDLEFVVELPPEITLYMGCLIRCQGRVLRTDRTSMQLAGVAAEILRYSIENEIAACA